MSDFTRFKSSGSEYRRNGENATFQKSSSGPDKLRSLHMLALAIRQFTLHLSDTALPEVIHSEQYFERK